MEEKKYLRGKQLGLSLRISLSSYYDFLWRSYNARKFFIETYTVLFLQQTKALKNNKITHIYNVE